MDSIPPRSIWVVVFIIVTVILKFSLSSVEEVSEARLSKLSENGSKKASRALLLLEKSSRVINSLKMLDVLFELFTAVMFANIAADLFKGTPLYLALILGTFVIGFIIHLFGIILSKKMCADKPENIMFSLMWLINVSYYVCLPFERAMSAIVSVILRPFGVSSDDDDDDDITEEEIRFMVDVGSESGAIEQDEKEMIHNIFELNDTPVKDVMTHRTDVIFLWDNDDTNEWEETVNSTNHSVYPVCGETVDDIVGIVKAADFYKFLRSCEKNKENDRASIIRSPYLVPESIKADELFRQMQKSRNHFSIVLDEYGGLAGIISMSDLLEEIVGDLDSDFDSNVEEDIVKLDPNTWKILGSTEIELVAKTLDIELPIEDYNTFAGMILSELGAVPDDGTTAEIEVFGLQIKVTKILEHRIEETLVCKIQPDDIAE